MDSKVFETASPTRLFFRCAIPSMISMVAGSLYQMVDGIFVGRYIGEDALAAINLVMPLIMIVFAISNMIATGASVRVSMLLGKGEREAASLTFTYVIKLIILISTIVGIIGLVCAEPIVRLLAKGATEEAVNNGITYVRVYAIFNPIMTAYFATDNFLRICSKEKLSMWINVATQVLNIILDIILIAFLNQGICAAAVASCVGMSIGSIITLLLFKGKRLDVYYTKGKLELGQLGILILNGSSEFFSNIAMSITALVFNFHLLKYGGTTGVAAYSVVMYVDSFVGMLIFGMCDALQPPISHCYGAGLKQKIKALLKRVMLAGAILSLISMLFMFFAGQYVATIFMKAEDIRLMEMSIVAMKLFSFSYLFGWIDMVISSYFTSIEKPILSLSLSLLGTLLFPIMSLMIMASFWGLNGVWLSSTVSGILISTVAIVVMKKYGVK